MNRSNTEVVLAGETLKNIYDSYNQNKVHVPKHWVFYVLEVKNLELYNISYNLLENDRFELDRSFKVSGKSERRNVE